MIARFTLNGRLIEVDVGENEVLLNTLRHRLGVTSVKRGCERGECGSCTVIVDDQPVLSCLVLTPRVDGRVVLTVEGLREDPLFKKLVESFVSNAAIQCGFCTPGILLTAWIGIRRGFVKSREDISEYVSNLCRCTGYVKIIDAIVDVLEAGRSE